MGGHGEQLRFQGPGSADIWALDCVYVEGSMQPVMAKGEDALTTGLRGRGGSVAGCPLSEEDARPEERGGWEPGEEGCSLHSRSPRVLPQGVLLS